MSKALLNDWMERLNMQDWTVQLQDCCDPDEMFMQEVSGCTQWQEVGKAAVIQIIDPDLYGRRIKPFDYEVTLVHELLHLKTCLITDVDDPLQARVGHMLIDDLAETLVAVKREALE